MELTKIMRMAAWAFHTEEEIRALVAFRCPAGYHVNSVSRFDMPPANIFLYGGLSGFGDVVGWEVVLGYDTEDVRDEWLTMPVRGGTNTFLESVKR